MDYSPYRFKNFYKRQEKKKNSRNFTTDAESYNLKNNQFVKEQGARAEQDNNSAHSKGDFYAEKNTEHSNQRSSGGVRYNNNAQDYSGAYHRESITNTQTDDLSADSQYTDKGEKTTEFLKNHQHKKKKDRTGAFVVAIIMLSFMIVIFATEFFNGGVIVSELKSAFKIQSSLTYYLLTLNPYDNEYRASTEALTVKDDGGAGYIYVKDNEFYVVLAVYLDKKSAEAVKKKNEDTTIITLVAEPPNYANLNVSEKKVVDKTYQSVVDSVALLYEYSTKLDSNNMTNTMVLEKLTQIRNSMLELKASVTDSTLQISYKYDLNKIIDPIFGGLDAITTISNEDCLAGAMRYVMCATILAYCK